MIYHIPSLLEFLVPHAFVKAALSHGKFSTPLYLFHLLIAIYSSKLSPYPTSSLPDFPGCVRSPTPCYASFFTIAFTNKKLFLPIPQTPFISKFSEMKNRYLVSMGWQLVNLLINLKFSLLCSFQRRLT